MELVELQNRSELDNEPAVSGNGDKGDKGDKEKDKGKEKEKGDKGGKGGKNAAGVKKKGTVFSFLF